MSGSADSIAPTPWLFTRAIDLSVFLGSALLALVLLALGRQLGASDTPEWGWVVFILLIDVAHVYSTAFRVYFDPDELRRRTAVYVLVPLLALFGGVVVYSEGAALFWRTLAYIAVFHFIRQQYGWLALYRARAGETGRLGWWVDASAIYLATVYPLVHWHAHLPREFQWFVEGDFAAAPGWVATALAPLYWLSLGLYALRSVHRRLAGHRNPGKDILVATTAVCWHVGIITFNTDYAFTVTNVIIHGVPYLALVYWYAFVRGKPRSAPRNHGRLLFLFVATVWFLAYVEELLWNRSLWHEHLWLFGDPWDTRGLDHWLVPLLAVPQLTHYILDGFIWRRRSNPAFDLVGQGPQPTD